MKKYLKHFLIFIYFQFFQVYNLVQKSSSTTTKKDEVESDDMLDVVKHMKTNPSSMVRYVVLTPQEYFVTAFDDQ